MQSTKVVGFFIGLALCAGLLVFEGWVLTQLWAWFVVPAFRVPKIGLVSAIGLVLVGTLLATQVQFKPSTLDKDAELRWLAHAAAKPGIIYVAGAVVHWLAGGP